MALDPTDRDRQVWQNEFEDFVPERVFDAHIHLYDRSCLLPKTQFAANSVWQRFGGEFTKQQLLEWTAAWLPGRRLSVNQFGYPFFDSDRDASGIYAGTVSDNRRFFGMALVAPCDSVERVRQRVVSNQLIGYKPYLEFVEGKPKAEITIHDMLPAEQMALADELGLAIMLHIPRPGRLADPVNQAQMVELCQRYPNTHIIFAHIGRAYYLSSVVGFLDEIAACPNAYVDTAMVNHEGVLEYAFRTFPRDRILFGSDAPIACLHGKSVEVNDQYIYLMGEDYAIGNAMYAPDNALAFTSFYYEQLRGIRLAAERAGLSYAEIANVFFGNAKRLFSAVAQNNYGETNA